MKKWKVVFWFAVTLFVLQIINISLRESLKFIDVVSLAISGFALMPIYGIAYHVVIGTRSIAIAIFCLNSLLILPVLYLGVAKTFANPSVMQLFFSVLAFLFVFMFFYPMYAYAFQCKDLWRRDA